LKGFRNARPASIDGRSQAATIRPKQEQEILDRLCAGQIEYLTSRAFEIRNQLQNGDPHVVQLVELVCFLLHKVAELETKVQTLAKLEPRLA